MENDSELDPKLSDAITRLRDTQPDRDLWPHIARHLEPRHVRGTLLMRWPTALAAGLLIAVATSAGTAVLINKMTKGEKAIPSVVATDIPKPSMLAVSMAPEDAALAHAVDDLEKAVRKTLDQLDPEARATVTKTLTMLDEAIAQATARQTAAPDDPRAAKFLTSTLRKKLQLLRTVSGLTQRQS
jgi:glutamyl-tRNA reductase